MFIVDKSDTLIVSDHCGDDNYGTEFREQSSSGTFCTSRSFISPYRLEYTILPPNFIRPRLLYIILFLLIITSSIITGIEGGKIFSDVQVKELNGITCEIKKDILEAHNDIRQAVAAGLTARQPPASNMRELYWDEELAKGAQKWADQCTFEHNESVDRDTSRFQVGQNIAITKNRGRSPNEKEFRRQVKNWFGEHALYTFGVIDESLRSTGHYTQLVWAETYFVGCGYSRFEQEIRNISYRLYVCNYGPSGNVFDEEPYEIGNRKCPEDTIPSRKYNSLCALKSPPADNCSKSLEQSNNAGREETRYPVNARRSNWLQNFQSADENRRILESRKSLSGVGLRNGNIDRFGSEKEPVFIIFQLIFRMR